MSHRRQLELGGLGLALAVILIWARDLTWMSAPADTLPLLLGLPLAYLLGRPWQAEHQARQLRHLIWGTLGAMSFAAGWILGSLTLLAISWTLLALLWGTVEFTAQARRARLAWLLLLSFPWLVTEWQSLGWACRLSSATVAESICGLLQLPVEREGTRLLILGVPIEIEASCAGWNLLQLTLLAGIAAGTREIHKTRHFVVILCLLPAIVWFANLLRILILAGIALSFDAQIASGLIHGLVGLMVLGAVLAITHGLCRLLDPPPNVTSRIIQAA